MLYIPKLGQESSSDSSEQSVKPSHLSLTESVHSPLSQGNPLEQTATMNFKAILYNNYRHIHKQLVSSLMSAQSKNPSQRSLTKLVQAPLLQV